MSLIYAKQDYVDFIRRTKLPIASPPTPETVRTRFIGDLHGKYDVYNTLIVDDTIDCTMQVGDFGFGFCDAIPDLKETDHFIRGNHDDPALIKAHPNWVKDGKIAFATSNRMSCVMHVGGAFSTNRPQMTLDGFPWWYDEQCSYNELSTSVVNYRRHKVDVMVTHDIPEVIRAQLFGNSMIAAIDSITRQALGAMLDIYPPKIWVFGHFHKTIDTQIGRTRFICLGINDHIDLDL